MAKFFTIEQLEETINTLKLSTTISKSQTFDAIASDLPLNFLARCLRYGFQRHFNDGVAGIEDKKTKCETVSIELGEILAGKFETKIRAATVPTETNVRRKVVLSALEKADKQKLAKMTDENRTTEIDRLWTENQEKLQPVFDEMMKAAEKPKLKISLGAIKSNG